MKLLVVTNLFFPDRGGGASVFSDMCYELAERGHDVTVYGAYPYYPEWENKSQANLWRLGTEEVRGVKVRRFGMYLPKNPSKFIPRVLFELSFTLSLLRSLFFFSRYDAVMVYCPLLGSVTYASIRRLFYWEPTWLNVQDIPADAASASGISKSPFTKWLGQTAQKFFFNRAKTWSTIAPKMVDRLRELTTRNQPIHLVPNFLNGTMAEAIEGHPTKVGRPTSKPIKLLYGGNIGKKQGLLEFCQRLAQTDLKFDFVIHGNGGEAHAIRDWIANAGDGRFRFGEFLDEPGFVGALFDSDLFVITEKSGVGASFIPSKLIPCIATGTPVMCVCDQEGPLGLEVAQHDLGIAAPWGEIERLLDELQQLAANADRYQQLQENVLTRAQAYSRGPVIDFVEQELQKIARK